MKAVPDIAVDRGAGPGPGDVAHGFGPREGDPRAKESPILTPFGPAIDRSPSGLREPAPSDDTFDAELERARRASGWSFIAVPAPIVGAPAVVAAAGSQPVVAWSSPPRRDSREPQVIVGIGIAHELRGSGVSRWREIIAGARSIECAPHGVHAESADGASRVPAESVVGVSRGVTDSGRGISRGLHSESIGSISRGSHADSGGGISRAGLVRLIGESIRTMAASDLARPRFLGGLAFVPGAADAAPWTGFGDAWFVLPRFTYVHDGTRAALVLAVDARDAHNAARWRDELATIRGAIAGTFAAKPQPPLTAIDTGDRKAFRAQVSAITDAITRGELAKVVAARSAVVTLAGEARTADMLAQLDERQAECVRLLVRPPAGGALVAATPERLVRLDGSTVACDALAGSVARRTGDAVTNDDEAATALFASTKDCREHALVVDAIATALRRLGADVSMPDVPGLRTLRHVLHLHTPISAELREPRHLLELAEALHPTPAVGGTPTRIATDWISARESAPRGWYASPVGWFDLDGNGELAVAIRSGLVTSERAHLWAGAGIVAGSDPDRELEETDLKLRAMLGALGVTDAQGERSEGSL